jgi:hypothetical protein
MGRRYCFLFGIVSILYRSRIIISVLDAFIQQNKERGSFSPQIRCFVIYPQCDLWTLLIGILSFMPTFSMKMLIE